MKEDKDVLLVITAADMMLSIINHFPMIIPMLFAMREHAMSDESLTEEQKGAFQLWLHILSKRNEIIRNQAVEKYLKELPEDLKARRKEVNETNMDLN